MIFSSSSNCTDKRWPCLSAAMAMELSELLCTSLSLSLPLFSSALLRMELLLQLFGPAPCSCLLPLPLGHSWVMGLAGRKASPLLPGWLVATLMVSGNLDGGSAMHQLSSSHRLSPPLH